MNAKDALELANQYKTMTFDQFFQDVLRNIKLSATYGSYRTNIVLEHLGVGGAAHNEDMAIYLRNLGYTVEIVDSCSQKSLEISWK